ncbi:MAG: EVE domain-containing protein [Acidobacteria bacterium]|nr:EVE domain-containing protein [Acidobacteriota bacterium]
MPQYWILKTEPSQYSYADLEKDKITVWDGVSNNLALKNLRAVQRGDLLLIYHTGKEKQLVGIAMAASVAYPDPKKKDLRLLAVDVKPVEKLPVTLSEIKKSPAFADFPLVKLPRLSVIPVGEQHWKLLMRLALVSSRPKSGILRNGIRLG